MNNKKMKPLIERAVHALHGLMSGQQQLAHPMAHAIVSTFSPFGAVTCAVDVRTPIASSVDLGLARRPAWKRSTE